MAPERTMFDDLEEMLAAATLNRLLGTKDEPVTVSPMEAMGFSANQFSAVQVGDHRLVLKHLSVADWLALAAGDHGCRSLAVWRNGALDRLAPEIRHGIVAGSRDGDGHALLMHDCGAGLSTKPTPVTARRVERMLQALAILHSRWWADDALGDPAYELADVETILTMTWPQSWPRMRNAAGPRWSSAHMGVSMLETGWQALLDLTEPDVSATIEQLVAEPRRLVEELESEPATLVHGDYRLDNVAVMPDESVVVLDWQFAAQGPGVMDVAWMVMSGGLLEFRGWAFDYYRYALDEALGGRLDVERWERSLAIAKLAEVLRKGMFHAYFASQGSDGAALMLEESNTWVRQGADLV